VKSRGFVVLWVFLRGVLEKMGAERGFLMVNLWWVRGELWSVDDWFLAAENFPLFS
jgi:hypothetical protein